MVVWCDGRDTAGHNRAAHIVRHRVILQDAIELYNALNVHHLILNAMIMV